MYIKKKVLFLYFLHHLPYLILHFYEIILHLCMIDSTYIVYVPSKCHHTSDFDVVVHHDAHLLPHLASLLHTIGKTARTYASVSGERMTSQQVSV